MAGIPPYQFLPPGHPAWQQAMLAQQQAQLAAQAQAQAVAQGQAMAQAQAAQAVNTAKKVGPGQMTEDKLNEKAKKWQQLQTKR